MTKKEKAIKQAHAVFGRAKVRGSLPDLQSADQLEQTDAQWIEDMREAKKKYEENK